MAIRQEPDVNLVPAMENWENDCFASVSDGAMDISHCYVSCRLRSHPQQQQRLQTFYRRSIGIYTSSTFASRVGQFTGGVGYLAFQIFHCSLFCLFLASTIDIPCMDYLWFNWSVNSFVYIVFNAGACVRMHRTSATSSACADMQQH